MHPKSGETQLVYAKGTKSPCESSDQQCDSNREQRKATKASQAQATWAKIQTIIGAFGVAGVVFTLLLTIKTTKAAVRQANAAEKALTKLERPYVLVDMVKINIDPTHKVYGPTAMLISLPKIAFSLQNVGRTPAIVKCIDTFFAIVPEEPPAPDYDKCFHRTGTINLPANGKSCDPLFCEFGKWITGEEGESILQGKTVVIFYGRVLYRDMSGDEMWTGFGLKYHASVDAMSTFGGDAYNYYL